MDQIKKIGFYGGTFDPVHFGHINLAIEAKEKLSLDEVWFCPTAISPHKMHSPPIEAKHRLAMLELALEGLSSFKIITNEIYSQPPIYTYETLSSLKNDTGNSNKEFTLLISEDLAPRLSEWHQIERLMGEFKIFIGTRKHAESHLPESSLKKISEIQAQKSPIRLLEISSQEIRSRIKNNLYCGHLCPGKVLDYICKHNLY